MNQNPKNIISFIILILLVVLAILIFALIRDRKKSKLPAKLNVAKYQDLINTLSIIDELLDRKIRLGGIGVRADYEFLTQQMIVLNLVSNGKLAIFEVSFTKDLMELFNDAEFNLAEVENASRYVKNELTKLQKLVK
jgi:hypothetical protein